MRIALKRQNVTMIWHKETAVSGLDAIVIPGGFSYGDYLRTGAIARFSPVMNAVREFAQNGGLQAELEITWNLLERVPDVLFGFKKFGMRGVLELEVVGGVEHVVRRKSPNVPQVPARRVSTCPSLVSRTSQPAA